MKKQTKGIFFAVVFGGGLLFWATAASMPNIMPHNEEQQLTRTGTPADNFPDAQRPQFCGTGEAKSNSYVKEYKIPTDCTLPLAITTDRNGQIWFVQTNTGNIVKFDPDTESFEEYENPNWPENTRSMMWGIDYSPDDSLWFTDDTFDAVWKFSISENKFTNLRPSFGNQSMPQRIQVEGSSIIFNDLFASILAIITPTQNSGEVLIVPKLLEDSFASDFAIDEENNIWYISWRNEDSGILVRFDHKNYTSVPSHKEIPIIDFIEYFSLPRDVKNPNGVVTNGGSIWFTDSVDSSFYMFNPNSTTYTKYVTSQPTISTYGNATGKITEPESGPYWIQTTDDGKIVFNEQAANRIGIFDPVELSLIEYIIPSKNPNWADCDGLDDCGVSQIFDFTVEDGKVWFSEWAENNIGYVDILKKLPFEVIGPKLVQIQVGKSEMLTMKVRSSVSGTFEINLKNSADTELLKIEPKVNQLKMSPNQEYEIPISINVSEDMPTGFYPISIGIQNDEIIVSQNVQVQIATLVFKVDPMIFENATSQN